MFLFRQAVVKHLAWVYVPQQCRPGGVSGGGPGEAGPCSGSSPLLRPDSSSADLQHGQAQLISTGFIHICQNSKIYQRFSRTKNNFSNPVVIFKAFSGPFTKLEYFPLKFNTFNGPCRTHSWHQLGGNKSFLNFGVRFS